MRRLDDPYYPVSAHRTSGYIAGGDLHKIYYEDSGNKQGMPLVLCHGGPGGYNQPGFRRLINGEKFRIIQFDQRGCGNSQPQGELRENSLQHTIKDMETLRKHLGIKKWVVTGGSWGSTVALSYAQTHPESSLGLLLVSMWLLRAEDIQWWFQGVRTVFPELWDQFAEPVPKDERHDLKKAYCKRIFGADKVIADCFATNLFLYEEEFMHFAHYASHNFFLSENQLIENAYKVVHLPAIVVTGRYDMCTTPNNSYDLCKNLPNTDLRIIPAAGHHPTETALSMACAKAGDDIYQRINPEICQKGD